MNEIARQQQFISELAARGDPLEVNLAQLIAQSPSHEVPDGSEQDPINIETQEPIPTQPVFSPERFFLEQTGTLGTIMIALFVANKYFNLGALMAALLQYLRNQNEVAQRILADSKRLNESIDKIDRTAVVVEENQEELIKIRRIAEEIAHNINWFYSRRANTPFDKPQLTAEEEDGLRRQRHS